MRDYICLSLLIVGCWSAAAPVAGQEKLYDAIVLKEGARVRSGPGKLHYPTESMTRGAVVEVYRMDPGNWVAVKPTEGSFSLVPASEVKLLEVNTGEILTEGTKAWVGTRLEAVEKPLWQVKLRKGEIVDILGEVSWPSPDGNSVTWYQIAPPDGEFRWVSLDDIEKPQTKMASKNYSGAPYDIARRSELNTGEASGSSLVESKTMAPASASDLEGNALSNPSMPPSRDGDIAQANFEYLDEASDQEDSVSDNQGWRAARHRIDRNFPAPQRPAAIASKPIHPEDLEIADGRIARERATRPQRLASVRPERIQPELDRIRSTELNSNEVRLPALPPMTTIPNTNIGSQLQQFDFQLSKQMAREPVAWQFEELKLRVSQLRNQANDPLERMYADRILTKIQRCEILRSNYRKMLNKSPKSNTMLGERQTTQPVGTGVDSSVDLGVTYDAFGWLSELTRQGGRMAPTYVLQDEDGKITHHISGAPGLNLRRYLKSKVGVMGRRGFHQQLNLNHVTAERIVELQKR